jgi:hypothetical protein
MNVKVRNAILKSKTLSWFQGKVQNDIVAMPNKVLNLINDLRISASRLSFGFDLTLELWHLNLCFSVLFLSLFLQLIQDI